MVKPIIFARLSCSKPRAVRRAFSGVCRGCFCRRGRLWGGRSCARAGCGSSGGLESEGLKMGKDGDLFILWWTKHSNGKSPFFMGKSTINGHFQFAMLVHQRVTRKQDNMGGLSIKKGWWNHEKMAVHHIEAMNNGCGCLKMDDHV